MNISVTCHAYYVTYHQLCASNLLVCVMLYKNIFGGGVFGCVFLVLEYWKLGVMYLCRCIGKGVSYIRVDVLEKGCHISVLM